MTADTDADLMKRWTAAQRQARRIGATTTEAGKRRAVLRWCRLMRAALRGTPETPLQTLQTTPNRGPHDAI